MDTGMTEREVACCLRVVAIIAIALIAMTFTMTAMVQFRQIREAAFEHGYIVKGGQGRWQKIGTHD